VRRAVLIAIALVALGAQPAAAAKRMEVAVQDDPVFVSGAYYDRERALTQARDMGATRIRANVPWASVVLGADQIVAPNPPVYDWAAYDSLVDAAARYGMRVQLTLTAPVPAFATYDRKVGHYGPNPALFGEFARAAAEHFKGRVDRYSIWNEPNYNGWLEPHAIAAALYRELYESGYAAIKRADPRAQVLIGETSPYAIRGRAIAPLEFLRDVTCTTGSGTGDTGSGAFDPNVNTNGSAAPPTEKVRAAQAGTKLPALQKGPCRPLKADGYAHHPYDYRHRPNFRYKGTDNATLGTLTNLTDMLQTLAELRVLTTPTGKPLPVYLTEYGYYNSGRAALGDRARASYLPQAYAMAQRNPLVVQMLQFIFVTPPASFPGGYFDLSIIRPDGSTTAPYDSLRAWVQAAGKRGQVTLPGAPIGLPPAPRH
jgi:hypothetical protein